MALTIFAAFAAGLVSFLSPCVLPLVPPYLCYLAGLSFDELAGNDNSQPLDRRRIMISALLFVAGFFTVFISLGATASALGQLLARHLVLLGQIAGIVIIIMGLHFLGVFRLALLYREARFEAPRQAGYAGAYLMGLAFAFGWTPCIGPVLAAILAVAASEQTIWRGIGLLAVYSAGLGVPFLLAALAIRPFLSASARFRRHLPIVEKVMGGALVATGVLFLTGTMSNVAIWLLETFPGLAQLG